MRIYVLQVGFHRHILHLSSKIGNTKKHFHLNTQHQTFGHGASITQSCFQIHIGFSFSAVSKEVGIGPRLSAHATASAQKFERITIHVGINISPNSEVNVPKTLSAIPSSRSQIVREGNAQAIVFFKLTNKFISGKVICAVGI